MKLTKFSFEREPIWIWVFSLGSAVLGLLIALVVMLMRYLS